VSRDIYVYLSSFIANIYCFHMCISFCFPSFHSQLLWLLLLGLLLCHLSNRTSVSWMIDLFIL
jgi:hypothetical protein